MARLKGAGAVLLGKGNMGEWAFSPTFSLSSLAGAVRNPYDLDRTPAGSSGGPAAGVLLIKMPSRPSIQVSAVPDCADTVVSTVAP